MKTESLPAQTIIGRMAGEIFPSAEVKRALLIARAKAMAN